MCLKLERMVDSELKECVQMSVAARKCQHKNQYGLPTTDGLVDRERIRSARKTAKARQGGKYCDGDAKPAMLSARAIVRTVCDDGPISSIQVHCDGWEGFVVPKLAGEPEVEQFGLPWAWDVFELPGPKAFLGGTFEVATQEDLEKYA